METIIINLNWIFGAIIGAIITIFCNKIWQKYEKRFEVKVIRKFWNFKNSNVIIIHPIYYGSQGEKMPLNMARIEDVLAMQYLTNLLNEMNINYKIQDDQQAVPIESDLILICSPKGNKQSLEFSKNHPMPYKFCMEQNNPETPYIKDTLTGNKISSPVDINNNNRRDVALLGRYTDNQKSRRVFLFWGVHGQGTLASVKYIINRENVKKINKEVNGKDFNTIILAPFEGIREIGEVKEMVRPRTFDS